MNTDGPQERHRTAGLRLFLISFVSLFFEILMIRWLPAEIPLLGFFGSLTLIACFLGLGWGCASPGRDPEGLFWFYVVCFVLCASVLLGGEHIRGRGFMRTELRNGQPRYARYYEDQLTLKTRMERPGGTAVIVVAFLVTATMFLPLGRTLGALLGEFRPLKAYSINVLGSLVGVLAFSLISALRLPPWVWFAVGLLPGLWVLSARPWRMALAAGFALANVGMFWRPPPQSFVSPYWRATGPSPEVAWSPYYKVAAIAGYLPQGPRNVLAWCNVYVNNEYHQAIINASLPESVLEAQMPGLYSGSLGVWKDSYEIPYRHARPRRLLVIASGVGNEVAAALRNGVEEIDAVEIDPVILELGRRWHPERPYLAPNVRAINDDARGFLQRTDQRYDMIMMYTVDSHTKLAATAGLRLDSYLYTVESFEQIRDHLAPAGVFVMNFNLSQESLPWARARLNAMLDKVFGPGSWRKEEAVGGYIYFVKPTSVDQAIRDAPIPRDVTLATDDWPQFYLRRPMIPDPYAAVFLWLCPWSGVFLAVTSPGFGRAVARRCLRVRRQAEALQWTGLKDGPHFFFLGAGFMLLEVRSITQLSLVFGSTWFVNSAVICAVLVAILLANGFVAWFRPERRRGWYALLLLGILLSGFLPVSGLLALPYAARAMVASLMVAAPIFLAGIIFATSFRRTAHPESAFGANLLGAVLGGLGEYLSLLVGVRALAFVILPVYLLSAFFARPASART